ETDCQSAKISWKRVVGSVQLPGSIPTIARGSVPAYEKVLGAK
ncbi:unnamed protein product, partial [Musa acuminata subsp. burmannicoides]